MTLIVAYRSGPNHVMAGDLLLTSSSPVTPTPGIPTRFEGNLHLVNNRIYGLEQKIFPVNSHLAVGWSANKRYIPDIIIRDIANNIATPPYTTATIREIERRLDSYPTDRCHFMFLLLINDSHSGPKLATIYENMILRQDESGEYRFGGSGSDHFSKMNFEAQTITGLDEYSRSIALLLGRVGRALYTELTSADSHQSFYGGGYELIEVTPSGIRKVPLTFVFWLCDHEPLPRPSGVVFSYVYDSNDVLGFRQFLINRDSKAWEQKIFPVHSFLNSAARPTFDLDRGIKTPWSIHYFVKPNAEHGSPMPVKVKNGDDPNISVEWDGTEVVAKVEDSFAPELKEIRATLNLSPWPSPFD